MNLNHLEIFHAVADAKSISRGAERLMISQPAVSKQLRQFEQALGMPLVDRLPKGVRLTAGGEILFAYARRLFVTRDEAVRAIAQLKGIERGRLAVGASTTIGIYLLPEVFAAFGRRFPAVELALEIANTDQIQHLLADGALDLALTEGFVESPDLQAEVFLVDELVPIAPPAHPLAKQRNITAAALLKEPIILREAGSGTRAVVERALAERGLSAKPIMSLGSTEAIKRAVAAGVGLAIVSRLTIETELKDGRLVIIPVADLAVQRPLHRVELIGKHRSPAVAAFLEMLPASLVPKPARRATR